MNFYQKNNKTIPILVFLIFLLGNIDSVAVGQTALKGIVLDADTGEELIGANVILKKDGVFVKGTYADIDGIFIIRVDPAIYDIEVSYTGYPTEKIEGITAVEGKTTKVIVQLKINDSEDWYFCPWHIIYNIPLLKLDESTSGYTFDHFKIRDLPTRNIQEISISTTPGVTFSQ